MVPRFPANRLVPERLLHVSWLGGWVSIEPTSQKLLARDLSIAMVPE